MSQAELGARLGISGTYIRKFERGQLGMGLELKAQLSRLTGIPLRRLLTKNEEALLASAIELLDDAA